MIKTYSLNPICPAPMWKVNKNMSFIGGCMVQWSGKSTYLVYMTEGGHEMVVDMKNHTCAWREYQLPRILCYHACACINLSNLEISEHIHKTYTK